MEEFCINLVKGEVAAVDTLLEEVAWMVEHEYLHDLT